MDIQVNGVQREVQSGSLAALLDELGYGSQRVATALNGRFVPGRLRADKSLSAGDAVEIVAPMQGG
jgi:sulfur carrier protein